MNRFYKYIWLTAFMSIGGLCYGGLEIISRGFTHISMGLLGGLCFVFIGCLGRMRRGGRLTLMQQLTLSTMFITTSELLCGLVTNLYMGLNVWDYSDVPLNFMGQICLPFVFLWFAISYLGALADEWVLRHIFRIQLQGDGLKIKRCSNVGSY